MTVRNVDFRYEQDITDTQEHSINVGTVKDGEFILFASCVYLVNYSEKFAWGVTFLVPNYIYNLQEDTPSRVTYQTDSLKFMWFLGRISG